MEHPRPREPGGLARRVYGRRRAAPAADRLLGGPVPHCTGVDHIALTVTDLDVSERSGLDHVGIALELSTSTEPYAAAIERQREVPDEEVVALASQLLGPDVVARR